MNNHFLNHLVRFLLIAWTMTVLAPSAGAQSTTTAPSPLQALVNDTAAQFQLSYRTDAPERQRRHKQLAKVVESWRKAERTETNDRLLAEWLRAAMHSSMPGSRAALPVMPRFTGASVVATPQVPAVETAAPANADAKWFGDPFGDDPLTEEPAGTNPAAR